MFIFQTRATLIRGDLGSTKWALLSSNEYSSSSSTRAMDVVLMEAGVTAVCIGMDIAVGVKGAVVGVFWGVLFSCSALNLILGGVLLIVSSFCHNSSCFLFKSSMTFAAVVFDGFAEERGEKGFRINCRSASRAFDKLEECCFVVTPAWFRPLLGTANQEPETNLPKKKKYYHTLVCHLLIYFSTNIFYLIVQTKWPPFSFAYF